MEGGVAAAFRREIAAAPDPAQRERELEADLRDLASPFRTAEAFDVEEIIDPRETPPALPICRSDAGALENRIGTETPIRRTPLAPESWAGLPG